MNEPAPPEAPSASDLISQRISELGGWRGQTLGRMRSLIKAADPDIVEEWKWRGTPVWSHDGIICTGESYKAVVKLTFAKGASLKDPAGLFNASLDGNTRRAIDIREGEDVDETAFKHLICQAVALNRSGKSRRSIPGLATRRGSTTQCLAIRPALLTAAARATPRSFRAKKRNRRETPALPCTT